MIASAEQAVSRILTEDLLTIAEARDEIAAVTRRRPDVATIYRWVGQGANGAKLESVRLGRQYLTSKQAITRFIVAQQGG